MFSGSLNDYLQRFGMDQKLCFSDLWCLADSEYELHEKKHAWDKHTSKGGAVEEDDWYSTKHAMPLTAPEFKDAIRKQHCSSKRSPLTWTTTRSEARCRSKVAPTHDSFSFPSATDASGMKVTRGLCSPWSTSSGTASCHPKIFSEIIMFHNRSFSGT